MIIRKPFYFMRHGLTDWNFEGLCQGQVDVPLNDTGVRQAYENIVQQHEITHVFYSPLKRASQTAEIVSKFISATKIEMIEIQECNFGNRQGKPWKLNSWADLKTLDYPKGETWQEFEERVVKGINIGLQKNKPLFVAHAGVYTVLTDLLKLSLEQLGNCTLIRFVPVNGVESTDWIIERCG